MNPPASQKIKAGAAAVDISPERRFLKRVWLAGYSPTRRAETQDFPIEARALALGEPGDGVIIVAVDTCLVSPVMAARWARAVSRVAPVPVERIFIVTTHTHSGPDFTWFFGGVPLSYYFKARDGIIEAARRAWEAREPASLLVGTAEQRLGQPRRKPWGQKDWDREMVVLQWRSGKKTVATLINLGCHGVVYPASSTALSGDLPAALCREADAEFGGVSLFTPRIQGDVNPDIPGKDAYKQYGNADELNRLARMGREKMLEAVNSARKVSAAPLNVEKRHLTVSLRNPLPFIPAWSGELQNISLKAKIQTRIFSLGGVEGIAVPGEALTCLGLRLLEHLPRPALLFSYCGGYQGYLMTRETYRRGGYEPLVSPGPAEPDSMFEQ